ncbi:hypothetical protein Desor_0532 [Desulfosporosinus orientis DSM 765]|uniref:RsbT co-antagonist protein RsbRD N-terminal domain-containing protein n=1 Tax=Desulfosporosinus orientis (strain ATCC 19365 / DSM 765 / NCIMB 8382 / VKM B-1628 / Singapore I) TaxID=768706 RepID=G7WA96_DESOD|nr:RsbRD N-terminal domain-containing protein [Desulfosporosinus orientis]AET66234.1 hypothetical protein Desor_0532 [Desulfosporosinus orientis DSM 765]
MTLRDLLETQKSIILNRWFEAIMATYAADTSGFLKSQKDQFRNPVGHTFSEGINSIFEALIAGTELQEGMTTVLDDIIKVRAVQNFTPAQALSFIFVLKTVVREELGKDIKENQLYEEFIGFEGKIDELALYAFNIYLKYREQLFELRTAELKRMTFGLLKRANLMSEIPSEDTESENLE